jgi:site-specific DNA-methyltransferase (adenine-specific)
MLQVNNLYHGDCKELIPQLEDNSIDLVVTSPPYNVDLGNNKYNKKFAYDCHDDNMPYDQYMHWLVGVFSSLYPKMKEGGRLCINVGDGKNGALPTHSYLMTALTVPVTYVPITTIIWDKQNVSARTAWGSFKSPSCPSFPMPVEYILVLAKGNRKLQEKGETDLTAEEFTEWAYGVWKFAGKPRMTDDAHPAAFPEELAKRCIKMFSWKGATVLDPFNGSGTTTKVARELGRNWLGFEKSEHWYYKGIDRTVG